VVRLLGEGATGEVYEVYDEVAAAPLALKTLHAAVASHPPTRARFEREIDLGRRVRHRNVCRAFDLGRHTLADGNEMQFLTMELLRGVSLADHLAALGRLTTEDALPFAVQMTAGLQAAHDAGIVYRDFKPANLVLVFESSGPPRLVMTDFGLARSPGLREETVTHLGQSVGTPYYMAPEQVFSGFEPISPAADVYALGSVLYEMVTGQAPFSGDVATILQLKRFRERPRSARSVVPDLDPRWDATISRCLDRDPGRRFQSAREVEAELVGAAARPSLPVV
jgi:serine/threonine protein kinase